MQNRQLAKVIFPILALLVMIGGIFKTERLVSKAAGNLANAGMRDLSGSNWQLQASNKLGSANGPTISQSGYNASSWYKVTVPTTVLAGLVANGVYKDPYVGTNLQNIDSKTFSDTSWWYRTTFTIPSNEVGQQHWLSFEGLSYRANIWLNGQPIATSKQVVGTFSAFEFDITPQARTGTQLNTLAVEIFRPVDHDLYLWFGDWIPGEVPDRDMGLTGHVKLYTTDAIRMRHAFVQTTFDDPTKSLAVAHLTVFTALTNPTNKLVAGQLQGMMIGPNHSSPITFSQNVTLASGTTDKEISFSPQNFPQLNINKPAVWWPWQWGPQPLYTLSLSFIANGVASDTLNTQFGIRQVESALDSQQHMQFSINGHPFLVRGAAWTPDMLLQHNSLPELASQVTYMRDLNLNTIRLEGKLEEGDDFYQLCDQEGIMVLAGWMFGMGWEEWNHVMDGGKGTYGGWDQEHLDVAESSLTTQMYKLRSHPSMLTWLNGSDSVPETITLSGKKINVEQEYLNIEKNLHWPNPVLPDAQVTQDPISGQSTGVREGQWGWEPPIYFYQPKNDSNGDQPNGGAYGFNTEEGPGVEPPPVESLQQFLPSNQLSPDSSAWQYHTTNDGFDTSFFTTALTNRYGATTTIQDYTEKAQLQAYEATRAYFEAFGRNKPNGQPSSLGPTTGTIHWMLNNAWPSMVWHLYDYYLRPGGAYFGAKIALEPQHIQYSYDDGSIWVLNSDLTTHSNLQASAAVYTLEGKKAFQKDTMVTIGPDGAAKAFDNLAGSVSLPTTYILRLTLTENGKIKSINSYWLSTKKDVMNYSAKSCHTSGGNNDFGQFCIQKSYADFKALQQLPKVNLTQISRNTVQQGTAITTVTVRNTSNAIALAVHLKLTKGPGGSEVLPIEWQDNYFVLLPGETRTISATYTAKILSGTTPVVSVDCFNNI